MNHQTSYVPQIVYQSPQVTTQLMTESPLVDSSFDVPVFSLGDDPIACLNKAMDFLNVTSSRGDKGKVILVLSIRVMLLALGETMQVDRQGLSNATTVKVKDIWPGNALSLSDQGMQHEQLAFLANTGVQDGQAVETIILNNAAFRLRILILMILTVMRIECKKVSMANISNYGSDVISKVPHSETYLNDMENQGVQTIQDFEQPPALDFIDNEIHSDSNIIHTLNI
ncbi:hypothetical protein Tco_0185907 [Tanacetum coccineum]